MGRIETWNGRVKLKGWQRAVAAVHTTQSGTRCLTGCDASAGRKRRRLIPAHTCVPKRQLSHANLSELVDVIANSERSESQDEREKESALPSQSIREMCMEERVW